MSLFKTILSDFFCNSSDSTLILEKYILVQNIRCLNLSRPIQQQEIDLSYEYSFIFLIKSLLRFSTVLFLDVARRRKRELIKVYSIFRLVKWMIPAID